MVKVCTKCFKEIDDKTRECECGGRRFIHGDLKVEDERILCKCGNKTFKRGMHIDYTDKAVTSMVCRECNNEISDVYYRDEDDLMHCQS